MHTPLQFAKDLTSKVNQAWADGSYLESVTPTTSALLTYWFAESFTSIKPVNFHEGQRQAILNTIYLHEVAGSKNMLEAYTAISYDLLLADKDIEHSLKKEKNAHAKYCIKMATGTGKTWVLSALLIWQYLNRKYTGHGNYTSNFLVVAPGIIVYERLLEAFLGRDTGTGRDFEQSDIYKMREVFLPEQYRTEVFNFFQTNVVKKEEIGSKVTGEGMIAVTNWHLLSNKEERLDDEEEESVDAYSLMRSIPLPGKSAGNDLNVLDNNTVDVVEFLRYIPDLMVFNDEAHHIHEVKKKGQADEVEWQKSLTRISETKPTRFIQVDFSATPYNEKGKEKIYFPHIIVDFELKTAIQKGLVKTLVLDERKEIATLELDFRAERDESGKVIGISEGQRIMLRAGLEKLQLLEEGFKEIDLPKKQPKMLIVCEDTTVVPFVEKFLHSENIAEEDVLSIHSNKKGEVGEEEWKKIKQELFQLDDKKHPRVVISVLMLREGFDVNNICVIVPLRSTQSGILLEQTIGRGLRLMWREPEFIEEKEENRKRLLVDKESPQSYFDILNIIEHPSFKKFYQDLMEGYFGIDKNELNQEERASGDIQTIELKAGYEPYDFSFPIIIRDAEEQLQRPQIEISNLPTYPVPLDQLKKIAPKSEVFVSEEVTNGTRFGDYHVDGGIMSATGYNDYIGRLIQRIATSHTSHVIKHNRTKNKYAGSHTNLPVLAEIADKYIRGHLFGISIDPFTNNNWRVLLIDKVSEHIIGALVTALEHGHSNEVITEAEVHYRKLSEVQRIRIRESYSVETVKSIYPKTGYPSHSGGFEKSFIEYAESCTSVQAHIKLLPYAHDFVRFRYLRSDGLVAFYYPDFIVRTHDSHIYLIETKGDDQLEHPNVQRKKASALYWIERVNKLSPEKRDNAIWHYVLVGQSLFDDWKNKGASMKEILDFQQLIQANTEGRLL